MFLSVVAIGVSGVAVIATVVVWRSARRGVDAALEAAAAAEHRARTVEWAQEAGRAQEAGPAPEAERARANEPSQEAGPAPPADATDPDRAAPALPAGQVGGGVDARADTTGASTGAVAEPEADAGLVRLTFTSGDGLAACVSNRSGGEIRDVRIDAIRSCDSPRYHWRPSLQAADNSPRWDVLGPGDEARCVVEFLTEQGYVLRRAGSTYEGVLSFTDGAGRRWTGDGNGAVRPVGA